MTTVRWWFTFAFLFSSLLRAMGSHELLKRPVKTKVVQCNICLKLMWMIKSVFGNFITWTLWQIRYAFSIALSLKMSPWIFDDLADEPPAERPFFFLLGFFFSLLPVESLLFRFFAPLPAIPFEPNARNPIENERNFYFTKITKPIYFIDLICSQPYTHRTRSIVTTALHFTHINKSIQLDTP